MRAQVGRPLPGPDLPTCLGVPLGWFSKAAEVVSTAPSLQQMVAQLGCYRPATP